MFGARCGAGGALLGCEGQLLAKIGSLGRRLNCRSTAGTSCRSSLSCSGWRLRSYRWLSRCYCIDLSRRCRRISFSGRCSGGSRFRLRWCNSCRGLLDTRPYRSFLFLLLDLLLKEVRCKLSRCLGLSWSRRRSTLGRRLHHSIELFLASSGPSHFTLFLDLRALWLGGGGRLCLGHRGFALDHLLFLGRLDILLERVHGQFTWSWLRSSRCRSSWLGGGSWLNGGLAVGVRVCRLLIGEEGVVEGFGRSRLCLGRSLRCSKWLLLQIRRRR